MYIKIHLWILRKTPLKMEHFYIWMNPPFWDPLFPQLTYMLGEYFLEFKFQKMRFIALKSLSVFDKTFFFVPLLFFIIYTSPITKLYCIIYPCVLMIYVRVKILLREKTGLHQCLNPRNKFVCVCRSWDPNPFRAADRRDTDSSSLTVIVQFLI